MKLAAIASVLVVLALQPTAHAETVVRVIDGDTVQLDTGRVRLACIDAPETRQGSLGLVATSWLRQWLPAGSNVGVRPIAVDRYGRQVAELFVGNTNVNLESVASGTSFAYWKYMNNCDRNQYREAENLAKTRAKGVWAVSGGTTRPWDWRRGNR